jgi:hypothetical protein
MKRNVINLIITFFFVTFVSFAYGQQNHNDQIINYLDGKKFYALLGISCAETTGGDFMYSDHCVLIFNKNEITVKQYSNRDRSYRRKEEPKAKEVPYVIKGDTVLVEGLQFLTLIIDTSKSSSDQQLRIYTPFDYFNPSKRHVYFTELKKGMKTYFAQAPYRP